MNTIQTGWNLFAGISALYTVLLLFIFNFPNALTDRPYDIPVLALVFVLMLLTNQYFITTLLRQQEHHREKELSQLLELQIRATKQKIEQTEQSERNISIYRHDLRHVLNTLNDLILDENTEAAIAYIKNNIDAIETDRTTRWCKNPILNAMFSAYFSDAISRGIHIEAELDIPNLDDKEATSLSLVFANAIENSIHAVLDLPEDERVIRTRCIRHPAFMFYVSNPYAGEIVFDDKGIPISPTRVTSSDQESEHGIGIRSILAYCEKRGAVCDFKVKDHWFTIRIAL